MGPARSTSVRWSKLDVPRLAGRDGPAGEEPDRLRRRARRAGRGLDGEPAGMAVPDVRNRQGGRLYRAAQYALPDRRYGLYAGAVAQFHADLGRPVGSGGLPRPAGRRHARYRQGQGRRAATRRLPGTQADRVPRRGAAPQHRKLGRHAGGRRHGRRRGIAGPRRCGRSRQDAAHRIHVGHHGSSKGRDAGPYRDPQHPRTRPDSRRDLRRRAPQLPADVPRLRLQRARRHVGADRREADPDGRVRSRRGARRRRARRRDDHARLRGALARPADRAGKTAAQTEPPFRHPALRRRQLHPDRRAGPGRVLPDDLRLRPDRRLGLHHRLQPGRQPGTAGQHVGLPDERLPVPHHRSGDRRRPAGGHLR